MISKSSASDSLLLKVITSTTLLEVFEGSEHDELDPVAELILQCLLEPDVGPNFDLIEPCPKFDLIDPEFDPEPVSGLPRTCLLDPDAVLQLGLALPVLPELHPCLLVALVVDHLFQLPPDWYLPHGTLLAAQLHSCTVALIVLHEHPSLDSDPPMFLTVLTVP